MKSLAEYLGVSLESAQPAPEAPELDPQQFSAQDFARSILCSYEYRRSVFVRVACGELPPQIETLLYHYAAGKPVDRLEVEDKTQPLNLTKNDLLNRIALLQSILQEIPDDEQMAVH